MSLVRAATAPRGGLGEYPGYYCYDASRPSWLPYWIDTFTEEACNLSPTNLVADAASCLNPLSADCSIPTNPNPLISGPGVGGPPLAAGNSTAGVDPIVTNDIATNVGQTANAANQRAGETYGSQVGTNANNVGNIATQAATESGKTAGAVVGGAVSGAASGLSAGLGAYMLPILLVGGVVLAVAIFKR